MNDKWKKKEKPTHRSPVTDVVAVVRVRLRLQNADRLRLPERGEVALVFPGDDLVVAHLFKGRERRAGGRKDGADRGDFFLLIFVLILILS